MNEYKMCDEDRALIDAFTWWVVSSKYEGGDLWEDVELWDDDDERWNDSDALWEYGVDVQNALVLGVHAETSLLEDILSPLLERQNELEEAEERLKSILKAIEKRRTDGFTA